MEAKELKEILSTWPGTIKDKAERLDISEGHLKNIMYGSVKISRLMEFVVRDKDKNNGQ